MLCHPAHHATSFPTLRQEAGDQDHGDIEDAGVNPEAGTDAGGLEHSPASVRFRQVVEVHGPAIGWIVSRYVHAEPACIWLSTTVLVGRQSIVRTPPWSRRFHGQQGPAESTTRSSTCAHLVPIVVPKSTGRLLLMAGTVSCLPSLLVLKK